MASNVFSRFLSNAAGSPSIYETIAIHERVGNEQEAADHPGAAIDEQNLEEPFHDQDLEQLLADAADSHITTESTALPLDNVAGVSTSRGRPSARGSSTARWMLRNPDETRHTEDEDDVPRSLMLEDEEEYEQPGPSERLLSKKQPLPPPVPGPSAKTTKLQWNTSDIHSTERVRRPGQEQSNVAMSGSRLLVASPAEKAMYLWTNVENLDNFLKDVYEYYLGKGIWSIMLSHVLELLTSAFVGVLWTFLTVCVDYSLIPQRKTLAEVTIDQCTKNMSTTSNVIIWTATFYWTFKLFQYVLDYRRLRKLHDFYLYLLDVRDDEMQTIAWQTIVGRLMNLRNANPRTATDMSAQVRRFVGQQSRQRMDKQRMDAHDIANRLMRRENYLIAMFNKEILDTTVEIPFLGARQLFSETIEWNVNFCVMDLVFNEQGQVKQLFLKDTHRQELIDTLKARFLFAGFMNVLSIPILIPYLLSFFFLRFFLEFQRNPSKLGARAYTRLAEWKFREFNELWHLFERRRDMSYPFAARYLDQFPKDKTVQLARFTAFIAGALGGILAVASILDNELFLGFEITPGRTVIFYLGILGTIWAVCGGLVPEENLVFDPEFAIQNVIDFTHHCPAQWEGRLHSDDVRREFATLYQPKIVTFVSEMLSIIVTPFILWFKLPGCAERLVDFFREFTIHVDGLGYVCSFAVFEFQKGKPDAARSKNSRKQADPREDYYSTKDGKMLSSYYNFLDSYAQPNPRHRAQHHSQFHPPPTFPGLSQHQAIPEAAGTASQARHRPRLAGHAHASPSPSLLLDPQHQPSPTTQRRPNRYMAASKLRQVDEASQIELSQTQQSLPQAGHPVASQSEMMANDSHLGESWKTTLGHEGGPPPGLRGMMEDNTADGGDEETTDDGGEGDPNEGQGVLGLLYQFQKNQRPDLMR